MSKSWTKESAEERSLPLRATKGIPVRDIVAWAVVRVVSVRFIMLILMLMMTMMVMMVSMVMTGPAPGTSLLVKIRRIRQILMMHRIHTLTIQRIMDMAAFRRLASLIPIPPTASVRISALVRLRRWLSIILTLTLTTLLLPLATHRHLIHRHHSLLHHLPLRILCVLHHLVLPFSLFFLFTLFASLPLLALALFDFVDFVSVKERATVSMRKITENE